MSTTISLLITSGNGPEECRLALQHVIERLTKEAIEAGLDFDIAVETKDVKAKSAVVQLHGGAAESLAKAWIGSICWTCKSKSRPTHKRQNWFVGVFRLPTVKQAAQLDHAKVRFETFRAGGPGGQHQNTTDSAVRAICMETGLTVVARDGRSQHRNKALALERLQSLREADEAHNKAKNRKQQNQLHGHLERGNPVRTFTGERFQEVKKQY